MQIKNNINKNYKLKLISSIISLIISLGIAIFNLAIGIIYSSLYNLTISIYMFCLFIFNLILYVFQIKNIEINKVTYILLNIFLLFMNLTLVVPIILLLLNKKEVNYGTIIGITIATYTTYKIITKSISFKKSLKSDSLLIQYKNLIGFNDCFVSLLTLQYALIIINDGSLNGNMLILSLVVSIIVFILINVISIVFIIKNKNRFIETI